MSPVALGLMVLGLYACFRDGSSGDTGAKEYVCVEPSFGDWKAPEHTFSDGSTGREYDYNTGVVTEGGEGPILHYDVFNPEGLNCTAENPCPAVLLLHGGGGGPQIVFRNDVRDAAKKHGFLLMAVSDRIWKDICPEGKTAADCVGRSMIGDAYVDSPNPVIGPGETDILMALDHLTGRQQDAAGQVNPDYAFKVDIDRIYLAGNSMGGRGTYAIGLKNPDRFAALGLMEAPSELRILWDYGRKDYPLAAIAGGEPDGPVFPGLGIPAGFDPVKYVDTMWTITSGRFLIENAANLPVFFAHGDTDEWVPNSADIYTCTSESDCDTTIPLCGTKRCEDYENSRHMAVNSGRDGWCSGNEEWCGEHWTHAYPGSLDDLRSEFSGLFASDEVWTPGNHCWTSDVSANVSEDVLWIDFLFDRFDGLRRSERPDRVLYKAYTDTHPRAYWLSIHPAEPWSGQPGMVKAARGTDRVDAALYGVDRLTLDLAALGADRSPPGVFTLTVAGHRINGFEDPRSGVEVRLIGLGLPSAAVTLNGEDYTEFAVENNDLVISGIRIRYDGFDNYEVFF